MNWKKSVPFAIGRLLLVLLLLTAHCSLLTGIARGQQGEKGKG
jgi:hypothetical protein